MSPAYDQPVRLLSRLLVIGAVLMAACGAPAASSPAASSAQTAYPAPSGSPSAADTREFSMTVSGLI